MIKPVGSYADCREFAESFQGDPDFSDPMLSFEENEPYNLFVLPEYRRRGFGRKLLAAALECNRPKGMMLLVDTDNVPAIRLYASMGFQTVREQNSLTAHWEIGADRLLKSQGRCRICPKTC